MAPMEPLTPPSDRRWINGGGRAANVWMRLRLHHDSETIVAACTCWHSSANTLQWDPAHYSKGQMDGRQRSYVSRDPAFSGRRRRTSI